VRELPGNGEGEHWRKKNISRKSREKKVLTQKSSPEFKTKFVCKENAGGFHWRGSFTEEFGPLPSDPPFPMVVGVVKGTFRAFPNFEERAQGRGTRGLNEGLRSSVVKGGIDYREKKKT